MTPVKAWGISHSIWLLMPLFCVFCYTVVEGKFCITHYHKLWLALDIGRHIQRWYYSSISSGSSTLYSNSYQWNNCWQGHRTQCRGASGMVLHIYYNYFCVFLFSNLRTLGKLLYRNLDSMKWGQRGLRSMGSMNKVPFSNCSHESKWVAVPSKGRSKRVFQGVNARTKCKEERNGWAGTNIQ